MHASLPELESFYENFAFESGKCLKATKLETDHQNLRLINGRLITFSSNFFANYMNIFHKTDIQMVILKC